MPQPISSVAGRTALIFFVALGILVLAIVLLGARLFDEPKTRQVASLSEALGAERILAVFAHPDDEMLVTEVLRQADQEGVYTALVTATRGERADQMPVVARQQDLGIIRHAEVLKHGFALGVDRQEVWSIPDRGVADEEPRLADSVAAALARHRPDLVITFWPASGISMHSDHMAIGAAVERAVERFAASNPVYQGPRWIAYPLLPRRALRRFGGDRGRTVAENQPPPTHEVVPIDRASKRRGWRIHASQRHYTRRVYIFPPALLYALWDGEFYAVVER